MDYKTAVDKGYDFLVEHYPAELADRAAQIAAGGLFKMADPSVCMLAGIGYDKLEIKYGGKWLAAHGFKIDDDDYLNDVCNYPELEQLWRDKLASYA